jgi:hypothetical protein
MSAAVLAQLFNSDGYCMYWQEYGKNFVIFLVVLYLFHIKKWATEILHLHVHSHFLNSAHLSISIEKLMHALSYNGGSVFRHTDTHELDDTGNLVWNLENRL